MPIYAYKCASCGHTEDVMRKISDAPLTTCTACGKDTFEKQLTAPGFQLKGSGWYATDFKGGNKPAETKPDTNTDTKTDKPAEVAATAPACGAGACPACTD
ncbi:MAG: zinc ribbon domain-containing protein [Betaproteobacteria bacterium]|nr:zinc ribbon domain-containing protein [Betaproteobacteria bacterium]